MRKSRYHQPKLIVAIAIAGQEASSPSSSSIEDYLSSALAPAGKVPNKPGTFSFLFRVWFNQISKDYIHSDIDSLLYEYTRNRYQVDEQGINKLLEYYLNFAHYLVAEQIAHLIETTPHKETIPTLERAFQLAKNNSRPFMYAIFWHLLDRMMFGQGRVELNIINHLQLYLPVNHTLFTIDEIDPAFIELLEELCLLEFVDFTCAYPTAYAAVVGKWQQSKIQDLESYQDNKRLLRHTLTRIKDRVWLIDRRGYPQIQAEHWEIIVPEILEFIQLTSQLIDPLLFSIKLDDRKRRAFSLQSEFGYVSQSELDQQASNLFKAPEITGSILDITRQNPTHRRQVMTVHSLRGLMQTVANLYQIEIPA